jgi:translation initiation factor 4E
MPAQATEAAAEAVRAAIAKINNNNSSEHNNKNESTETEQQQQQDDDDNQKDKDQETKTGATTVDAGLLDPKKDITVFSSQSDFNVKHPLYSPWTMWFDSASKQASPTPCSCSQRSSLTDSS